MTSILPVQTAQATAADLDEQAAAIGREHGTNAATWDEIDSTNAAPILAGIEDGDPAVLDSLNEPNLSGEYAGDYVSRDLARDLGVAYDSLDADQIMAFAECEESCLLAAAESYWDSIAAACRLVIESDAIDALKSAGYPVEYVDGDALHVTSNTLSPYGHYRHATPQDGARAYVDLGYVAAGDDTAGQQSTLNRSNYRSLMRDYPDGTFMPTSYVNCDSLGAYVGDLSPELVTILVGLKADYPLYDDSDLSERESEGSRAYRGRYDQRDVPRLHDPAARP